MSPNLTLETRLSSRFTLQLGVATNPTHLSVADLQLTNLRVEPELRYWFNRPMARHFIALSTTAATYNLRYKDHHFNGDAVAAGISYGYALVLGSPLEHGGGMRRRPRPPERERLSWQSGSCHQKL